LFSALYAGQTGILELRTVPLDNTLVEQRMLVARLRTFIPVVNGKFAVNPIARFMRETHTRRMAAYFGVALRTQSAAKDRKGDRAHCHWLTALYVDADFKLLGEIETRRRLAEFPLPPSIVVNSGGGLHVYWLLRTPLDLQRDYPGAQSILRRLAKGVADIVDVECSEPARVLRIPGSLNFKKDYDPPRVVIVEQL
jgi:hypothetical protein